MQSPSVELLEPSRDRHSVVLNEEVYEVWLACHQAMGRIHDRDAAELVGGAESCARNIPEYFSDAQRKLAEYILTREAMRAVGRC